MVVDGSAGALQQVLLDREIPPLMLYLIWAEYTLLNGASARWVLRIACNRAVGWPARLSPENLVVVPERIPRCFTEAMTKIDPAIRRSDPKDFEAAVFSENPNPIEQDLPRTNECNHPIGSELPERSPIGAIANSSAWHSSLYLTCASCSNCRPPFDFARHNGSQAFEVLRRAEIAAHP